MIELDSQNWPLAIVLVEEAMSPAEHRSILDGLRSWLDRDRPFVLLWLFVSQASAVPPAGASPETTQWLAENAARMRALVKGVAVAVLNGWSGEALPKDLFGALDVPTRMFGDGMSAIAWLRNEILAPIDMRIDDL